MNTLFQSALLRLFVDDSSTTTVAYKFTDSNQKEFILHRENGAYFVQPSMHYAPQNETEKVSFSPSSDIHYSTETDYKQAKEALSYFTRGGSPALFTNPISSPSQFTPPIQGASPSSDFWMMHLQLEPITKDDDMPLLNQAKPSQRKVDISS